MGGFSGEGLYPLARAERQFRPWRQVDFSPACQPVQTCCTTCCATCCTGLRRILVHFYTNEKISETQMRKSQRRSHRRAGKFIMYTFPDKFENVNPLTFLDRFGILVRFSVFVRQPLYSYTDVRQGWG
jgi:hypothetical protein